MSGVMLMNASEVQIDPEILRRMKKRILEIEVENANESKATIVKKICSVIDEEVSKCY